MKQKEQNNISRQFNVKTESLKVYLINLGNIRNICAHDEKLYDVILKNRINITDYHKKLGLVKNKEAMATRDLFSIIIILKILLKEIDFKKFYLLLLSYIENLESKLKTISINKVLNKMGFPKNYKDLLNL